VLAGIDTHKDTLAVAVIDDTGRPVVVTELANTEAGFDPSSSCWTSTRSPGSASRARATTAGAPRSAWQCAAPPTWLRCPPA
jgi:hypothetical protein